MKPKESIGRWISLIYRQGQIHIGKELQVYNIGSGQFPFLTVLYDEDGLSQEEISRILNVDKATAGRDIKRLAEEGYVERKRNPEDRRAYKIFLTEKGKKVKPVIRRVLSSWTSILSSDFTEEEKDLIIELLKRMYQNALQSKYPTVNS
ncbi:MAG: MarR family transcriptional regulator [Thermoplasmata archaeon]